MNRDMKQSERLLGRAEPPHTVRITIAVMGGGSSFPQVAPLIMMF